MPLANQYFPAGSPPPASMLDAIRQKNQRRPAMRKKAQSLFYSRVENPIVLAIDPGTTNPGWALIAYSGRILRSGNFKPSHRKDSPDAMDQIGIWMKDLIIEFPQTTDVAVEIPDKYQKYSFAVVRSYCRSIGIIEGVAIYAGRTIHRVSVNTWKSTQKKHVTRDMIRLQYGLDITNENEADAIGLGLWLVDNIRFARSLTSR